MLKFWSQIGLFVQIAIVVAAVVLFNLFDPFGWLNTKKLTLEDTPISVKSIREVGKLPVPMYRALVPHSTPLSPFPLSPSLPAGSVTDVQ